MAVSETVAPPQGLRPQQWLDRLTSFRPTADGLVAAIAVAGILVVIGIPLAVMVFTSFRGPEHALPFDPTTETTLANYAGIVEDASLVRTVQDTLLFVTASLAISLGFGIPLAWLTQRTDMPGRRLFYVLLFVPYLIPGITRAQIWALMLGPQQGLLNQVLRLVIPVDTGPFNAFSPTGIIVAQGLSLVPLVTLFVGAALRNIDASLEEASRASGAGLLTTLRKITIPLALPSVAGVALILFVLLIDAFEIPLIFGASTKLDVFGMHIWKAMNPESTTPFYGQVAATGVVMTLFCYVLIILYNRITTDSARFATVGGKGQNAGLNPLRSARWPLAGATALFIALIVVLPLFGLIWQSLLQYYRPPGPDSFSDVSLDAYSAILGEPLFWSALRNTLVLAFASASIVTLLAAAVAWTAARNAHHRKTRTALDLLSSSSLAVPGPILAFSMLMFFIFANRWIPLYGTMFGLVLAYCFRMGFAYRMSSAGLVQIGKDLEEASAASGADGFTTFRKILLPLIIPTLVVVFILGIIGAFNEFTLPLFLAKGEIKPLGTYIFGLMNQTPDRAAAVGVLNVMIVLVLATLANVIGSWKRG